MEGKGIDWTEMTFDTAKFFFKEHMEKSSIEFTITCCCGGDVTSILTTTNNNMLCSWTKIKYEFQSVNGNQYLRAAELTGAFDL